MHRSLKLEILPQPDDLTCGPTALHAVYAYYGDDVPLEQLIEEVPPLKTGGTLGVWLATHALRRGYVAVIVPYNFHVFDPTWAKLSGKALAKKLVQQRQVKKDKKLAIASAAYLEFLKLGGKIQFKELTRELISSYLNLGYPILTGLSATYLYDCAREYNNDYDDIRGEPMGHFVVLSGYNRRKREVMVADPLADGPRLPWNQKYSVDIDRLINAILLGVVTYDGNLLVIEPRKKRRRRKTKD